MGRVQKPFNSTYCHINSEKLQTQLMKKSIFFVLLLIATSISAQEFSMDLVQDMKPRNIGPAGMSGRVTSIDVVHSKWFSLLRQV